MAVEDARRLYYESRVRLVRLKDRRDRILRKLQWDTDDAGRDGAYPAIQDSELLHQLNELTVEIAATAKRVNQYAEEIGSPRVPDQEA